MKRFTCVLFLCLCRHGHVHDRQGLLSFVPTQLEAKEYLECWWTNSERSIRCIMEMRNWEMSITIIRVMKEMKWNAKSIRRAYHSIVVRIVVGLVDWAILGQKAHVALVGRLAGGVKVLITNQIIWNSKQKNKQNTSNQHLTTRQKPGDNTKTSPSQPLKT